jgi:hypothetical protein
MGRLTFPILGDGLIVDVLVNLDAGLLLPRRARGQDCDPAQVKGIPDTGSNVTGVRPAVLAQLGIQPTSLGGTTTGVGGTVEVRLYRVSLHVYDASNLAMGMFTNPSVVAMELPPHLDHDVLIGMDVLLGCVLTVDGPARRFTLDFP